MSMFDIRCRCNKFRSLSLLSRIVLWYGVFNRLIPDVALSALVDPMGEIAPKINNLRIFEIKSVIAKFEASLMPSGGSSKVKPGLPSTFFLVFDAPCISSDMLFNFFYQKLYHYFNSERKCAPSFVISLWYSPVTPPLWYGHLHALSHWGGTNFSRRGNFKSIWSNLVWNKIQVIIQDNKRTYYKIKGFFTINWWRPIVLFILSNNFNSEIPIFYLSFLIYIYKYR